MTLRRYRHLIARGAREIELNNQGIVLKKEPRTSKHDFQYLRHKGGFSLHYKPSPEEATTKQLLCIQATLNIRHGMTNPRMHSVCHK